MIQNKFKFETPILFLIFNRAETAQQVFQAIRLARPPRLYVAADGPRENKEGEAQKVESIRNFVISNIDWECEVKTLFREKNLGCRIAVSSAIDWFFENEEQGIILEDDCLPDQSFFRFCQELLEHYINDERIMMISGTNSVGSWKKDSQSYHYSIYGSIWGWATWKRAWQHYDEKMALWQNLEIQERLSDVLSNKEELRNRKIICEKTFLGKINTWDYQWTFARLIQSGLSIVPSVNLVQNIGLGRDDATHTASNNRRAKNVRNKISFPILKNIYLIPDRRYDRILFKVDNSKSYFLKLSEKLLNLINLSKS